MLDCRYVSSSLSKKSCVSYPLLSFIPRAERKKEQVCSLGQYQRIFDRLNSLPPDVKHLVIQVGIPIAYPRMVFLETALESKFNPLVALGRSGSMGLSGFVNKFNAEAELLDDLVSLLVDGGMEGG